MKTPLKTTATVSALLAGWLAMAGSAQAGADGSPGARSARPAFATNHNGRGNDKVNLGSHTMIVPGRVGPPISDVALIR